MYTISKTHRFEAAHRLVNGYQGNCAHLHGHSWVVTFECEGENLDSYGMLRDFGSFKEIRKWIDDNLDHATMLSANDHILLRFVQTNNQRATVFMDNPTSEHLAKVIFHKCKEIGMKDIARVHIEETCTSKATYGE